MYNFNKNRYLNYLKTIIGIITLVWWCALYPELCFPQDTYEAVYEQQDKAKHQDILSADDEDIVIESKFLEWFEDKLKSWTEGA